MQEFIVFGKRGQAIVHAETLVRAIQSAMLAFGGVAHDWTCHRLSTYPAHLQTRLRTESTTI
jgi:hypothetical protein